MKILNNKQNKKGFTLIEMIISVGIFTIIMTISIGALLIVIDSFRKTRLLRNTMENVTVATNSMVRKIRRGSEYDCDPTTTFIDNCPAWSSFGGNTKLGFKDTSGIYYIYKLDTDIIKVCKGLIRSTCIGPSAIFSRVTSSEIKITSLKFYVTDSDSLTGQGKVSITMSGSADLLGKPSFNTNFDIQTTISKRTLDS